MGAAYGFLFMCVHEAFDRIYIYKTAMGISAFSGRKLIAKSLRSAVWILPEDG